jgi:hypothetical protein
MLMIVRIITDLKHHNDLRSLISSLSTIPNPYSLPFSASTTAMALNSFSRSG